MQSLNKRSVAAVLAHDADEVTRQLLRLPRRRPFQRRSLPRYQLLREADLIVCVALICVCAATGRWTSPGPMLYNLKRNEMGVPLSVIDAVCRGRSRLHRTGAPQRGCQRVAGHALRQTEEHTCSSRHW